MRIPAFIVAVAVAAAGLTWRQPNARAQSPQRQGFEPLEQVVEDRGPLRQSLRHVEPGLGRAGQDSFVYRRQGGEEGGADRGEKLYFIERGVVAEFDRSQYVHLRDGTLLQTIPPNTVFHLGTPDAGEEADRRSAPDHPLKIRARVDRRVDATAASDRDDEPGVTRDPQRPDAWRTYQLARAAQRRSVVRAIGRVLATAEAEGGDGRRP